MPLVPPLLDCARRSGLIAVDKVGWGVHLQFENCGNPNWFWFYVRTTGSDIPRDDFRFWLYPSVLEPGPVNILIAPFDTPTPIASFAMASFPNGFRNLKVCVPQNSHRSCDPPPTLGCVCVYP